MTLLQRVALTIVLGLGALLFVERDVELVLAQAVGNGSATGAGSPGPIGPSGVPGGTPIPTASTLCIYNQLATLDADDEFQSDTALSISPTPSSAGTGVNAAFTTMWSDEVWFGVGGRRNNVGTDDSYMVSEGPNLSLSSVNPSWLLDGSVASPFPISLHTPTSTTSNDGYLQLTAVPVPASHSATVTTSAITSTGAQTVNVTPGTGTNFTGRTVLIDPSGAHPETVTVSSVTANSITATFAYTHASGVQLGDPTLCPAAAGSCAHWLTGSLEAAPVGPYGYSEWSGTNPTTQGAWPSFWQLCAAGCTGGFGTGDEEFDVSEYFSTDFSCPSSSADPAYLTQQTDILSYTGSPTPPPQYPTSYFHRTCVSNMGTTYHTYGVLKIPNPAGTSQPGLVQFFIDRQATTPFMQTSVDYKQTPMISLQIFTQNTYAPGPPSTVAAITEYVKYYRHYNFTATPGPVTTGSPPFISKVGSFGCQSNDLVPLGNTIGVQPPTPVPTISAAPTPTPTASPTPVALVSAMLQDGAVLLWPMQETAGSTITDLSGQGNTGAIGSGVTPGSSAIQTGFTNTSYLFPSVSSGSGQASSANYPYAVNGFSPTTAFTAVTWIKFSSISHAQETLMVYGNLLYAGGPAFTMTFQTSGNGTLTATMQAGSGPTTYTLTSPSQLATNTEHMVAITYGSGTFALWIDPTSTTPSASVAASGNVYLANAGAGFWVGDDGNGEEASFSGNGNYTALFPTALTGTQLETLYGYH